MTTSQQVKWQRWAVPLAILLLIVVAIVLEVGRFPESWNLHLRDPLNEFKRWIVVNRKTHFMFLYFFEPLSAILDFIIRRAEDILLWLPWPVIIATIFLIANRLSGLRLSLLTTACLLLMGLFGLWDESMVTLALMLIAVLLSLIMGIPLGIWAARNDRAERFLRPILDAMQTMPAFVYLIPVLLFFGIARVPSLIATIIYALPPVIRLTSLGIHGVSEDALEAARSFGVTEKQLLWKVQIPLAMPSILAGINQSIMMALSIVIIAALIGSGGLGDSVLKALRRLRVGEALEAGLAIVVMAILLDRLSAAFAQRERHSQKRYQGFRLFADNQQGKPFVDRIEEGITAVYTLANTFATKLTAFIAPKLSQYSTLIGSLTFLLILLILSLSLGSDSFPAVGTSISVNPLMPSSIGCSSTSSKSATPAWALALSATSSSFGSSNP